MALDPDKDLVLEGVTVMFRNFGGKPDKFTPKGGRRRFVIGLNDEIAAQMMADGWPVKILPPRSEEEDDVARPIMEVKINFEGWKPPKFALITSRGRTYLGEGEVEMLDYADIINCDVIVRPYPWNVRGETGYSAYLQSAFITIHEDPLELKYSELEAQAKQGQ
jgi:hypothetical protein